VAKTLIFYAKTARYDFKIFDLGTTYQGFDFLPPVEVNVADWEIAYQPNDNVLPGIVPSTCTVSFFLEGPTPTVDDFREVFKTAEPDWVLEVSEGIASVWRGFVTPDLGEIELRNGKRFIKVVASDGFQMFDKKADYFKTDIVRPLTDIIATAFTFCRMINVFEDGFYISEHYQPTNSISGFSNQGGLWITGTPRAGLIFNGLEPRSTREIIQDICTTFNLQLFQDKGSLVFRSCHIKTPAWYNYYDSGGTFIGRITPPATTQSEIVFSDGTELYKPAAAQVRILHPFYGSPFIWYVPGNFQAYNQTQVGNPVSNGTTEIDFSGTLRIRYELPGNFGPALVDVDFIQIFQYDGFYWNGSTWQTTFASVTQSINFLAENPSADPAIFTEDKNINNYKLTNVPAIGSEPLYYTLDADQTGGPSIGELNPQCTAVFEYKAGAPQYVIYIADNTSRVNGVTEDLETTLGDIRQEPVSGLFNVLPGSLRYWPTTTRTANSLSNAFWDGSRNELLELVSVQIARKAFRTHQYYEIELDGNISYNHTFTWGGVDYKPVNLTISERSTRITYREFIDGNLVPSTI
jgi:hypothetical protein